MLPEFSFAAWLSAMMGLKFMNPSSFAKTCSVNVSTVKRWRDGAMTPKGKHITAIARALGTSETDVRAAIAGGGQRAIIEWNEHIDNIQQSWKNNWEFSPQPEVALRFFDLVEEVCSTPLNLTEVAQHSDSEVTVTQAFAAMITNAVERMRPESLAELAALVESLEDSELQVLLDQAAADSRTVSQKQVIEWLRWNKVALAKLVPSAG